MPIEVWADPESGNASDDVDTNMGEVPGDEELESVLVSVNDGTDRKQQAP